MKKIPNYPCYRTVTLVYFYPDGRYNSRIKVDSRWDSIGFTDESLKEFADFIGQGKPWYATGDRFRRY